MEQKESYLYVVGISHKTASVAVRERYQINRKVLPQSLKTFFNYEGVQGVLIVPTCNRLEFYLVLEEGISPLDLVEKYYLINNIDTSNIDKHFYTYSLPEVTRHLFRVICGLESLVLGEYQIQGQIKEAYSVACEAKTCEKILHKLFHAAFRAGKNVRNSTSIGSGKQSVSGVASKIFVDNLNKSDMIAVIGVNENTKILSGELKESGFSNFLFVNRTLYKAEIMAEQYGGKAFSLEKLDKVLSDSKAIFTSTGAPGYIINNDLVEKLILKKRLPKLIVDMAVPRDIDASLILDVINYWAIGRLQDYLNRQIQTQIEDIPVAENIIEDEVLLFRAWTELQNNNILEPYAEKFELVRQELMKEYKELMSDRAFSNLDRFSRSLIHRLQSTFTRAIVNNKEK
ncbi:MAG: glutamyl-tRNA reductase [Ignavibacteriae bacterium]|nr:glutamyl-tRNA reductase [Ignavibacteriota bacterium]